MARSGDALTRRGLIAAAALAAAPHAFAAQAPVTAGTWTHDAYLTAMRASGRPVNQTQAQFDAIQARKPAAMKRIAEYLKAHLGQRADRRHGGVRGSAARLLPLHLFRARRDARRRL